MHWYFATNIFTAMNFSLQVICPGVLRKLPLSLNHADKGGPVFPRGPSAHPAQTTWEAEENGLPPPRWDSPG